MCGLCRWGVEVLRDRGIFLIRLCSDGAAYEAIPKRRLRINIQKLKQILEQAGACTVTLSTPQFLHVVLKDSVQVTFVDDGRMIIRNVPDGDTALKIAETALPDPAIVNR